MTLICTVNHEEDCVLSKFCPKRNSEKDAIFGELIKVFPKERFRARFLKYSSGQPPWRKISVILCLIFFLSTIAFSFSPNFLAFTKAQASSQVPTSQNGLVLVARPPILPADGGSYSSLILEFENVSSGVPIVPENNTVVQLSSSSPQIGTVSSPIMFPAGSTFVNATFHTTPTPGNTTVIAFASGFQPAIINVTTRKVGGLPSALNVLISPSKIPPDSRLNASILVQAVDVFGDPVKLSSSLSVTLSSSSSQLGSVPSSLVIPAGHSFAEATFSPRFVSGQTVITASAAGYSGGSGILTTVGPTPRRLVVSIAPALIVSSTLETATVSVQLQDNNSQTPAPASAAVSVVLTSNNTAVAVLPQPIITIPAGRSYATVILTGGGSAGFANITASAQGYVKGSSVVVASPVDPIKESANQLQVYFAPDTLLPDNSSYSGAAVVALEYLNFTSGTIYPALSTSNVSVYARSSNNASMQVSTLPGIILSGHSHVSLNVSSTFLPGRASITAQSIGLSSSTMDLVSFGLRPNALELEFSPSLLISDGSSYNTGFVSLIDQNSSSPARAPVNTVVRLVSNSSAGGTIQNTVTIPAGQTYTRVNFTTSGLPGFALITATASNYTATFANLTLLSPPAAKLGIYAAPHILIANGQAYQNLVVQLQDLGGNPQKIAAPVNVTLVSPSSTLGTVQSNVTVKPGSTFAVATLYTTNLNGSFMVTAFANGFRAGSVKVNTILLPDVVQIFPSYLAINGGNQSRLTIQATTSGTPLSNASIKWIVITGGIIVSSSNRTDSKGTANAVYLANNIGGNYILEARISKAGYMNATVSTNVNITAIIVRTSPFFIFWVGSSRVDLQACKLEYSIVSPK